MAMQQSAYDRFQCLPFMQQVKPMWNLHQYDEFNGKIRFERKDAIRSDIPVHDYFIFYPVRVPSGDDFLSMHLQKEDHHRRKILDNADPVNSSPRQMEFSRRPKEENEMKPRGNKVSLIPNRAMKAKLSTTFKPAPWHKKKSVQLTPASKVMAHRYKKAVE